MKMKTRPCRVIIAGGAVAGLALALMLDRIGVDYLLLEAYSEIEAKAGAGVTLLPNGLRILDQLGLYADILSHAGQAVEHMNFRNPQGELLSSVSGWEKRCAERYGYPVLWIDRTVLLKIMYSHIADQSKVLTQKRVQNVKQADDTVEVITTDGSIYSGDILIGADGTHSQVRQEMVRSATERGMNEYAEDDNEVAATYSCVFGRATAVPGIPKGCLDWVVNKDFSYLVGTGPDDRTYWLLSKYLGDTVYGTEIPRFTEDDLDKAVREHWNDPITADVTFADLYQRRSEIAYKSMREFVHTKWYLDRTMVIGDGSHTMTGILGQGGMQAIETAAALSNTLYSFLSDSSTDVRLSLDEIQLVFKQVQEIRSPRATYFVDASHQRNVMDAMATPDMEDLMLNRFPKMLPGIMLKRWDEAFAPAVSLHMLPIPDRPKAHPFHDEIEKPQSNDQRKAVL